MRIIRFFTCMTVFSVLLGASASYGQSPSTAGVPLISQVTPPSLSPASLPPGSNSLTLTILGANFVPGESVTLTGQGVNAIAVNPTINATGTQMVANFTNIFAPVPTTITVTVTKRDISGAVLLASNPYSLPLTPSTPTVLFQSPVSFFVQGSPTGMAAADFNRDGVADLAVVSQFPNTVSILTGNVGGTFNAGASYPTGYGPTGIAAADFNGDGVPDLAVTNSRDNTVTILLGNGDGTFRTGTTVSDPGGYPTQLVAADFNGDGKMDLAVLNLCGTELYGCPFTAPPGGPGNIAILLGNGDGTFNVAPTMPATGLMPTAIVAADLNQDGFIDLIVANYGGNTLTPLMGNGDGTFSAAQSTPLTGFSGPPSGIAVGDFNGDGALDVAVASSGDAAVAILLNQNCAGLPAAQCSLTLTQFPAIVPAGVNAIATADMNADGFLDLVVVNSGAGTVSVLLGDGTGKFNPLPWPNQSFAAGNSSPTLALLDVNMDGRLDVVTAESVLRQESVMQLQLTPNNLSIVYGYVPTFNVQLVPPPGAPAGPSGTVTLYDGSTAVTSYTLSGYQYQFQFVLPFGFFFGAGTHQLTAIYSGDTNFAPVTSNAVTATVATSATTTTLSSNVTNVPYGVPVTLTASIQPQVPAPATGTVTFTDTTNSTTLGTATLSNNSAQLTLTNPSVGVHTIVASYQGDANCTGSASSSVSVTVTQASTTTTVSASPNQTQFGQSVTLTAALQLQFTGSATPTGTVTFLDGSTSVGTANVSNNAASLSISTLAVGGHVITAQYNGDSNFQGSSGTTTEVVSADATTTTVTSGTNPSSYGQAVTYTVSTSFVLPNLGTPAGLITLYDGSTVLSSAFLSKGSAQFTVSSATTGTHSITAQYAGTTNYAASTSTALTQTVNPCATTISVSASPNPSSAGQSVTLYGTLQSTFGLMSTGGTITFYNNGTQLGSAVIQTNNINTESGGNQIAFVTINTGIVPVGSQTITAKYSGDANLQASTGSMTQTVNPAFTSMAVTANPGAPTYPQNVTFTATLIPSYGNTPTGTVTFSMNGTTLGTASVSNNAAVFSTSTPLPPGGHTINAQYSGDANDASSTNFVSITVAPPPTTTVLTSSVNPSSFNQAVAFVATPQSSVSGTPTGTMTFYDGQTSIGSSTLASGSAQLGISGFQPGTHTLTATYSGDFNFAGSTSAAISQVVNVGPTVTTVTSLDNPMTTPYIVRFLVTATATYGGTPSGTVTLYDGSTVIGSGILDSSNANGNTVQINVSGLTAGSHSITAKYSGSVSYGASTSSVLTQVMNLPGTTTSLSIPTNPVAYGQSVTLTASLVPGTQPTGSPLPSGTVTFFDGATSLGNGTVANNSAQISVSSLAVGSHMLTAKYNGDSNYTGSTSLPFAETVNQASTTATVSSSSNPTGFGQSVTFTTSVVPAYGGSATGTVTFFDGATSLGTANLSSNSAQLSLSNLAAGSHSITANYAGDANFAGSTSAALTETVNPASSSITITASPNPATFEQAVTLVATVQPAAGTSANASVTFMDGSTPMGTVIFANNSAQLTVSSLAVGTHSITAVYSGNTNFSGSTSAAVAETVGQGPTTLTVTNLNPATYGQAVTFVATVQPPNGGSTTGTIAFQDGTTSLGTVTVSNNTAQLTVASFSVGTHSITAKYSGDSNFTGSTATISMAVSQASSLTSLNTSANPLSYGQSVTLTATVQPGTSGTPTGPVVFFDGSAQIGSANLSAGTAQLTLAGGSLSAGTHSLSARYAGDANFTGSTSSGMSETVNPAATTTVLASSGNPSVTGQTVTFTASVTSGIAGTQSGTVSFYLDGATTPASSVALSGGAAQFSTNSLSAGNHAVVATFISTNANFQSSSAVALTQAVTDFSITASPASQTISRGRSGTYTLTLSPVNGFNGNVSLSCSGAPANVTCSVSPTQVTLNGTGAVQATVTVTTNHHANTGTSTLTFSAVSGTLTHSSSVTLTIN